MPIYALNQVNAERVDWLVPGMLEAKVLALVKSLHQRPRSRLVPLPEYVAEFVASHDFAQGEPAGGVAEGSQGAHADRGAAQ